MYYKIEGCVYLKKGADKDVLHIDRIFKEEEPCVARYKCFDAYMSYLDVFYMSIDKKYTTHDQAEKDLKHFLVKDEKALLDNSDYDNFIDIKFIFDEKKEKFARKKEIKDFKGELLIHSLGSRHNSDFNKAMCLEGLRYEYQCYYVNGYFCEKNLVKDKKGNEYYKSLIDYSQFDEDKVFENGL